ncbi:hypothetical protein V8E54_010117 [Elaphomyces granulatus]
MTGEILSLHKAYWQSTRAVYVKKDDDKGPPSGDTDEPPSGDNDEAPPDDGRRDTDKPPHDDGRRVSNDGSLPPDDPSNSNLTYMPIEGMMFTLRSFTSNLRLDSLEEEQIPRRSAIEESQHLSSTFGREIEYLRYEGSTDHKEMVEAIAKKATEGIWALEGDSDDEDTEEIVEGAPTPVLFFDSSATFPCAEFVTQPMIPIPCM